MLPSLDSCVISQTFEQIEVSSAIRPFAFTTTSANSFTVDVATGNSLYKGTFAHRDGVSGTTNLPTVTDPVAAAIYNWYPWVSLGVELAAVPVGWVRGHAWG
jgi:hypothetical protein